jgi:hypothetical protein
MRVLAINLDAIALRLLGVRYRQFLYKNHRLAAVFPDLPLPPLGEGRDGGQAVGAKVDKKSVVARNPVNLNKKDCWRTFYMHRQLFFL